MPFSTFYNLENSLSSQLVVAVEAAFKVVKFLSLVTSLTTLMKGGRCGFSSVEIVSYLRRVWPLKVSRM